MKSATAFSLWQAVRRAVSRAWRTCVQLLYERTILVLAILFCAGGAGTLWYLSRLSSNLIQSAALEGTGWYSEAMAEFRTLYTSEVVVPVPNRAGSRSPTTTGQRKGPSRFRRR